MEGFPNCHIMCIGGKERRHSFWSGVLANLEELKMSLTLNHGVSNCWMKTLDKERSRHFQAIRSLVSFLRFTWEKRLKKEPPKKWRVLTSPNFPGNYPNNLHERRAAEVEMSSIYTSEILFWMDFGLRNCPMKFGSIFLISQQLLGKDLFPFLWSHLQLS